MKLSKVFVFSLLLFLAHFCVAGVLSASILIIAPHPDDDVLYASGIAYNAVEMGKSVRVVYITNGESRDVSTGYLRQGEAVTGQSRLGLEEDSLIFLGYPSDFLAEIFHFYPNESDVFTAPSGQSTTYGTRGLGRVDYHSYRWGVAANYNLHNIVLDLQDILLTYKPTHIITTSEFDTHIDHRTTYDLLTLALANANALDQQYNPIIYKTIVHWSHSHGSWPNPFDPDEYFSEIPNLTDRTGLEWHQRLSLRLPHYAISPKINAISEHRSQGGVLGFLGDYVHKDEIFWVERLFGGEQPPMADAGGDQVVRERDDVLLDGSGSRASEGNPLSFHWSQTAGPSIELLNPTVANPSFVAPQGLTREEKLTLRLIVADEESSALPDFVQVTVTASNPYPNIAPLAQVSASSENIGTGQQAIKAVDGVIDGYPGDHTREWATLHEGAGAWLQLDWTEPYIVDRVILYDRPNLFAHILRARLHFSDGSNVQVGALDNVGRGDTVVFSPIQTTSLRMIVEDASGHSVGLAEIEVFGAPPQVGLYILSTAVDPPASGAVVRTPDQPYYSPGAEVVLQATAASGYDFSHWTGAASGSTNPVTVTLDGSKSVTAHFAAPPGVLAVSPEGSADFQGRAGGPFTPNRVTYTLANEGGNTINWRVTATANWLSISPTEGILQPGGEATVALSIINRETRNLQPGTYTVTIVFENLTDGVGSTTRQVNLTITTRR